MHAYIWVIPEDVAESSEEAQAHAHILMQDPTHAAEQGEGLADQLVAVFQKPWNKSERCRWASKGNTHENFQSSEGDLWCIYSRHFQSGKGALKGCE